jgi:hypothetical protein
VGDNWRRRRGEVDGWADGDISGWRIGSAIWDGANEGLEG